MPNKYFSAYEETSDPEAILKWLADEQTQELMRHLLIDDQKPFKLESSGDLLLNYSFFLWYTYRFNPAKYLKYMDMLEEEYGGLDKLLNHMQ